MKIVVGIVSYGLWANTRRCLRSFFEEAIDEEIIIIDANPDDRMPEEMFICAPENVTIIRHRQNMGFPFSVNDLKEEAFVNRDDDYLFIMGNDTVLADGTFDAMRFFALTEEPEFLFAEEIKVREFERRHPHASIKDFRKIYTLADRVYNFCYDKYITGFQNCSLISKRYFEAVGYVDTGFYPAYYEDLDYVRRGRLAGMEHYKLEGAYYLHDESATLRSQDEMKNKTNRYFRLNAQYYGMKWGYPQHGQEKYDLPFAGLFHVPLGGLDIGGEYMRNGLREPDGSRNVAKEFQLAMYFAKIRS